MLLCLFLLLLTVPPPAEVAFRIADPDLIPEGIAYDPKTRTFFVGSTFKRKIVAVDAAGRARDFTTEAQDGIFGVLGLRVDADRRILWAISAPATTVQDLSELPSCLPRLPPTRVLRHGSCDSSSRGGVTMWIQLMAALVVLAPPALAQRGVIESVTPGSRTVETGQSLSLTVRGTNPCGAVEIDPGDGSAQVLPISHLPATVTITLRKPGQYTIRAKGQGNCDGTASVDVRAVGRDLTTSQRSEDPSRAEPRRREEVPLTARRTVTVRAADPWTDTGVRVLEGDAVRLEASGEVTFAPRMAVGPQGAATARVESAPFPERPAGALIARIGDDSSPIFIGAAGRTFRAVRSGPLWLGINDDYHADNSGAFRVHVSDAREDTRAGRRPQPGTRTRGGSAVPSQWDVRVPAVDTWTDTGVMLAAGDILRLEASGVVHLSQNARDTADPAGSRTRLAPRSVFPDRPAGGLIARIGQGAPIYVGARQQTIRVTENGRLFLGVNDDHTADNGGTFEVRIAVSSPRR